VTDRREMDPDLVRPAPSRAGIELRHLRECSVRLEHAVVRPCLAPALDHCHLHRVADVPSHGRVDDAVRALRDAPTRASGTSARRVAPTARDEPLVRDCVRATTSSPWCRRRGGARCPGRIGSPTSAISGDARAAR
jgi:hypothetical protein